MTRTPIYYLESLDKANERWRDMTAKYEKPNYIRQIGIWEIIIPIKYKPKTRYVVAHHKRAEVNLNLKEVKRIR